MPEKIKSPCLGICSTVYGDDVCKGCKRFAHEIIAWNSWPETQKSVVYQRLERIMEQVMAAKLTIDAPEKLESLLERYGILFRHFSSHHWWLFLLWVKKRDVINCWSELGVRVSSAYQEVHPAELLDQIDDEVNILADKEFIATT